MTTLPWKTFKNMKKDLAVPFSHAALIAAHMFPCSVPLGVTHLVGHVVVGGIGLLLPIS